MRSQKGREDISFIEVSLGDKRYFSLSIGKRLVKKDIRQMKGSIPIYSANVKVPIGYGDHSNITDFSKDYVLWGIDGDFEFNYIKKGSKFITTDHCGSIKINDNQILGEYLQYSLYLIRDQYGYDRALRASLTNMKKIKIKIPIDDSGTFDMAKQVELCRYYSTVMELKENLRDFEKRLHGTRTDLTRNYIAIKSEPIPRLFEIILGSAKFDHKYFNKHRGIYPVYSGKTTDSGVIAKIDTFDHDCEGITWTIDGYAGRVFHRNGKFSMTTHCGLLKLYPQYIGKIDYDFLTYLLDNILPSYSVGEGNKRLKKTHISKVSIDIPINNNGDYDLKMQRKIASDYKKIELIKNDVIVKLEKVLNVSVVLK